MLFADDVLCNKTIQEVEERLEVWKRVFKKRDMEISRKKTEYFFAGVGNAQQKSIK